jgi:hypothetical protein
MSKKIDEAFLAIESGEIEKGLVLLEDAKKKMPTMKQNFSLLKPIMK